MSQRKYTAKEIEQIMLWAQDVISLNTPVSGVGSPEDSDTELGDFIVDTNPTPAEEAAIEGRKECLAEYLRTYLTPREREVILLRYGFIDNIPLRLEEIGQKYGLSRERVRQIEARALRKLRFQFAKNKITWENI